MPPTPACHRLDDDQTRSSNSTSDSLSLLALMMTVNSIGDDFSGELADRRPFVRPYTEERRLFLLDILSQAIAIGENLPVPTKQVSQDSAQ